MELLFLGTGTSAGVPMIACDCRVCRSRDPRDQRTRPSVLISYPHQGVPRRFLIDTAQELRLQMLRHQVQRLDAVLFTHAHADHIFGLDDLRRFNAVMKQSIDLYADAPTMETLRQTFWYIFEPHRNVNQSFIASLSPHTLTVNESFDLHGTKWTPLRLMHGNLPILGFRLDQRVAEDEPAVADAPTPVTPGVRSLAYCTDVSRFPDATLPLLQNLDVLVIDALGHHPHPTHQSIDQALAVIDHLRPRRAYLTHLAHGVMHAELEKTLPANVFASYDGLTVQA